MLTLQASPEKAQRLLLAVLVACFMAIFLAEVNGAETKPKPTTTKPSDPSTQSLPYYDPMLAFCAELEPFGYWYYYWNCQRFEGGGR